MKLIKEITILDPPTKYVKKVTRRKQGSKKKGLEDIYYLTANLFYSNNVHFSLRSDIVNSAKGFLLEHFKDIPKLNKIRLDMVYQRPTDNFDLDNKIYFWQKILLDLMKTPSAKEEKRALMYKKEIKTLRIIKDDSCKYVSELNSKYQKGKHLLKVSIYEIKESENLFKN